MACTRPAPRPERHLATAALAALIALAAPAGAAAQAAAPDFAAPDLAGETQRLSALRGRATIVAFWATWCFPCRYELPLLHRLHERYAARGLSVVTVASNDAPQAARDYVRASGFGFRVLLDPDGQVLRGFGAGSVPASYLLDADGHPLPLTDPATGQTATRLDNPLLWSDPAVLARIESLLEPAR